MRLPVTTLRRIAQHWGVFGIALGGAAVLLIGAVKLPLRFKLLVICVAGLFVVGVPGDRSWQQPKSGRLFRTEVGSAPRLQPFELPPFLGVNHVFEDVPTTHRAYADLDFLVRDGIIIGYPEGYFGKRALTRYEILIAIDRTVRWAYADTLVRAFLNAGVAPQESAVNKAVWRLLREFGGDLAMLGEPILPGDVLFRMDYGALPRAKWSDFKLDYVDYSGPPTSLAAHSGVR